MYNRRSPACDNISGTYSLVFLHDDEAASIYNPHQHTDPLALPAHVQVHWHSGGVTDSSAQRAALPLHPLRVRKSDGAGVQYARKESMSSCLEAMSAAAHVHVLKLYTHKLRRDLERRVACAPLIHDDLKFPTGACKGNRNSES